MPQNLWRKDKTHPPREGTEIQKEVCSGRVEKSKSKDMLSIILVPFASLISGVTESGGEGAGLVLALSRLEVSELALVDNGR